jgi:hypothetical protein
MSESLAAAADKALEAALAESGARDPREFYRERLRELKQLKPAEYQTAVAYYTETLLPEVAKGEGDPLAAWTEYGRRLAEALTSGRTVAIDRSGRAGPFERADREQLVLHLPDDSSARALLVGLPPSLSAAQRATYDVLVAGKQRLPAGDGQAT